MNIVHLLGRLVTVPELRIAGEKHYCRFRIAVSRGNDNTDFFNIVAWNKTAEFVTTYFKKGERIIVHGSIRNSDYTDKEGKTQYSVEISADRLEFVETLKSKNMDAYGIPEASEPPLPEAPEIISPDELPN
jgi:single-strand DNA-binding protein